MASAKDILLVKYLAEETDAGRIKWEFTANEDQFVTAVKGKYKLMVMKLGNYYLRMLDNDDKVLLSISSDEYDPVEDLFKRVRRGALNVDAAIDDIIGG
jgi:hypothetical protein